MKTTTYEKKCSDRNAEVKNDKTEENVKTEKSEKKQKQKKKKQSRDKVDLQGKRKTSTISLGYSSTFYTTKIIFDGHANFVLFVFPPKKNGDNLFFVLLSF